MLDDSLNISHNTVLDDGLCEELFECFMLNDKYVNRSFCAVMQALRKITMFAVGAPIAIRRAMQTRHGKCLMANRPTS
jgi:hypothetical protein